MPVMAAAACRGMKTIFKLAEEDGISALIASNIFKNISASWRGGSKWHLYIRHQCSVAAAGMAKARGVAERAASGTGTARHSKARIALQ